MNPPSLGEAALAYARRGLPVFPLAPGTKVPLIPKAAGGKGHKDATDDPEQIRRWWTETPQANIGLYPAAAGLVVVDPDTYKPGCAWDDFIKGRTLPRTWTQRTARGGRHYIYAAPPGAEFAGSICGGVEVKHDGYIVLAPSVFEGKPYAIEDDANPAPCPDWVPRKDRPRLSIDTGRGDDLERVRALLREAPNALDRGDWVRVAFALKHAFGEALRPDWLDFSARYPGGQKPGEAARVWDTAQPDGRGGIGTVFHLLGQEGMASAACEAPCHTASPSQADNSPLFRPVSDLAGKPVPPRDWHVPDLVPGRNVTLLGGDGGVGKSLLAAQLAAATALGRPWLGRETKAGTVLYLSAEDDDAELHRRFADIARAEGVGLDAFHNLHRRSLAGEDALLAALHPQTKALAQTPLYDALDVEMRAHSPALAVLDTLADLHGGDENNQAHARQFIALLRGLAIRHACAVLVLAHPSLTGMASGSGLSGSTAWNNSVRSRLYFERVKDETGFEPDPDARRLVGKKANYSRTGDEIGLRWADGVFVAEAPASGLDRMAASAKAQRVFLKLLRRFTEEVRYVSASPGPTFAPAIFASHPGAEGCTKRALRAAMDTLLGSGAIHIAQHGTGAKARSHLALGSTQNAAE